MVGDLRVGAGIDVIHEQGMAMGSLSLYPVSIMVWHHNYAVSLAWPFGRREGWNGSLGLLYKHRKAPALGTHLNLIGQLSYCGRRLCISGAHISHGAALGIEKDEPNSGLNFVFLEYRLR